MRNDVSPKFWSLSDQTVLGTMRVEEYRPIVCFRPQSIHLILVSLRGIWSMRHLRFTTPRKLVEINRALSISHALWPLWPRDVVKRCLSRNYSTLSMDLSHSSSPALFLPLTPILLRFWRSLSLSHSPLGAYYPHTVYIRHTWLDWVRGETVFHSLPIR